MTTTTLKKEKLNVRKATFDDYEGVISLEKDAYQGRDTLPYLYSKYIHDPDILCYVSEYKGEIVTFMACRLCDDHTFFEGTAGRTAAKYRSQNVFVSFIEQVKADMAYEKRTDKHRFVTLATQPVEKRIDFRVMGYRTVIQLCWDTSITVMEKAVAIINEEPAASQDQLQRISLAEMKNIFSSVQKYSSIALPGDIVIFENGTYGMGYPSNANLIFKGNLTYTLGVRGDGNIFTSMSFCTPIPCGNEMRSLRIGIDYYGPNNADIIKSHIAKHLLNFPTYTARYPWITSINCHIFMPKKICTETIVHRIQVWMNQLGLHDGNIPLADQCYGIIEGNKAEEELVRRAKERQLKKAKL